MAKIQYEEKDIKTVLQILDQICVKGRNQARLLAVAGDMLGMGTVIEETAAQKAGKEEEKDG